MPAPPSSAQKAANKSAMDKSNSVSPSGGKGGTSSSKSSPSGGMKSGPGATGGAKTPGGTTAKTSAQKTSTSQTKSTVARSVPGTSQAAAKNTALGRAAQSAKQNTGYSFSPSQNAARVNAVSRGPGVVSGALPGSVNQTAQRRTVTALGNSIAENPTFNRRYSPGALNMLPKAVIGEAQFEGDVGRAAVANVMMNRLALGVNDPASYGYMGAGSIPRMMRAIDAAGVDPNRPGLRPNAGYRNTVPGTETYADGLRAVADSLSPYSEFSRTATPRALNATHYYNDAISNPKWGERRSGTPFDRIGNHVFGNAERTAGQVASIRSGPPTGAQFASAAIGSIPRPVPRPPNLRGPVPRPTPRPDSFPRGFGDAGIGRTINPYSPAPPVPNMRPDTFPRGFGDMGIGRTVNQYTPPSFGDQGVGRTVNPYSQPAPPVPTARPDSFPRGFGDQGVGRPVNPYSAPVSPFSDAGIRKPVSPFAGQPPASIVPPIPKARPPMQGPPRPIGGMSFTPGLPDAQKRYYDRVAQTPGPQQPYSLPGYPGAQPAGTYTAPYDRAPRMSPFGNVGEEYHKHSAPPTPSQYRNEAPPAAPHLGTPASQTAQTEAEPSFWQQGGDLFKQASTAVTEKLAENKKMVEEIEKKVGPLTPEKVKMWAWFNGLSGGGTASTNFDNNRSPHQMVKNTAPAYGGAPSQPPTAEPDYTPEDLIALKSRMVAAGASPEEIAFVDSLINQTA